MLVQSPLWCRAIIGIILIYCYDFIIFHLNKGRYMKRNTFIFRIDLCNSNNQIIYHFYPLNNSIPLPRVLTICNNIFMLLWVPLLFHRSKIWSYQNKSCLQIAWQCASLSNWNSTIQGILFFIFMNSSYPKEASK